MAIYLIEMSCMDRNLEGPLERICSFQGYYGYAQAVSPRANVRLLAIQQDDPAMGLQGEALAHVIAVEVNIGSI